MLNKATTTSPAAERPNLKPITGNHINEMFSNNQSQTAGVSTQPHDLPARESFIVKVKKEVVLAAGTLHSPQALQVIGIGPAILLEEIGTDLQVDLLGAVTNFQGHAHSTFTFSCERLPGKGPDQSQRCHKDGKYERS